MTSRTDTPVKAGQVWVSAGRAFRWRVISVGHWVTVERVDTGYRYSGATAAEFLGHMAGLIEDDTSRSAA